MPMPFDDPNFGEDAVIIGDPTRVKTLLSIFSEDKLYKKSLLAIPIADRGFLVNIQTLKQDLNGDMNIAEAMTFVPAPRTDIIPDGIGGFIIT